MRFYSGVAEQSGLLGCYAVSFFCVITTFRRMCQSSSTILPSFGDYSPNHNFCNGKAISITYSECVFVALVIQNAERMRRILLQSVACTAGPHLSLL